MRWRAVPEVRFRTTFGLTVRLVAHQEHQGFLIVVATTDDECVVRLWTRQFQPAWGKLREALRLVITEVSDATEVIEARVRGEVGP